MATPAASAVEIEAAAAAAGTPAAAPDGQAADNAGPPTLWAWLAPHRVPPTAAAYGEYRPFFDLTRHILGAEPVDLYGVFLVGTPEVMATYVGLLGPSLGPALAGLVPAVDAGLSQLTPTLRRTAMAAASATARCGYCTAHTVGMGSLLGGSYRGERGGGASTITLCPLRRDGDGGGGGGGGSGGGGTAESAVAAYAAAAAAWPPALTPAVTEAAAAALRGDEAAVGALRSCVAYTGFLNTTMALLEPPLEKPLVPWVSAVVAASPDLAGHPVEAKAAAAADGAPAPADPTAPPGPRGVWAMVVTLARLLPSLARVPAATERLVLGGMPRDAAGVTATVRAALGGHLPPVLAEGVLPTAELRRAVAAAYVDHFGPCPSAGDGAAAGGSGSGGSGGGGGDGRHRRHWSQAQRVGLLGRFAATAGDAALAAEAAALAAALGLPTGAAAPHVADVAGRVMDAAAARTAGGLDADAMAAVVASGLPPAAVVEAVGLAGFVGYLQRLWVVFLWEA